MDDCSFKAHSPMKTVVNRRSSRPPWLDEWEEERRSLSLLTSVPTYPSDRKFVSLDPRRFCRFFVRSTSVSSLVCDASAGMGKRSRGVPRGWTRGEGQAGELLKEFGSVTKFVPRNSSPSVCILRPLYPVSLLKGFLWLTKGRFYWKYRGPWSQPRE